MILKKNNKLLVVILLLVIGFAGVATTLVINGKAFIGANESDYKIFFSEAILDGKGKTIYNKGGTAIQKGGISKNNFGVIVE